jgi:hypothetical protein
MDKAFIQAATYWQVAMIGGQCFSCMKPPCRREGTVKSGAHKKGHSFE